MPTIDWDGAERAELYVRSDLPTPAQRCRTTIRSRLEDLVESGAIAAFSVTSWAKRVPLEASDGTGEFERARHDEFAAWAREHGVRLTPFFDTRECYSTVTGERRPELVLPAACLALYDADDELVGVAPYADGPETVTVHDCLRALAEGGTDDGARAVGPAD